MSVVVELNSHAKANSDARKILGPGGNRVRVSEEEKKKKEGLKKKLAADTPIPVKKSVSSISPKSKVDNRSSAKSENSRKKVKELSDLDKEAAKVVRDGVETLTLSPPVSGPVKRCEWITQFSEPIYTAFHDGEWGVPVYEERKLFELLVLSQTLSELTWPTILSKREVFRKLFDNFDPISIASIDDKQLLTLRSSSLLSEQKLRAIVENSKQVFKVQSFYNQCHNSFN
ncbi:OLC1v1017898C1 [Oldenlandia corymbosa var. corymbosa]|uniref:OLC1v1017898C1 n=1 Tax=Oldenlandia corymbosa var. corymbosa TaxID=529605 RepID=A0AAV1EAE5_OLDCO|nr:OLC1v1017898C1 [Oldenlandia corymbosa var. corymbosa]